MAIRVLHCPWVVGGNPAGLAAAERELGLESTTVVFGQSPYGYAVDEELWAAGDGPIVRELKRWGLVARALRRFDVIHFNFGSTILPQRIPRDGHGAVPGARARAALLEQLDLRLLARMGKAIFVTFQGDDARQGDLAAQFEVNPAVEAVPGYYSPGSDADKRRRIAGFDRHADGIYALNPDLLRVLPDRTRFVPYAHVDPRAWKPQPPRANDRPFVLHAPTSRDIKGTRFVVKAVERLQAEGVELDFRLVEGLSHAELHDLYARADLVVDQLLAGWYGGLAVESMALGRPVVSYLRDEDLELLPSGMREEIPVISAQPETIHGVLKKLLTGPRDELEEIGGRGRAYVERWHDPLRIAQEIVADYEAALASRGRRRSDLPSGSG